MDGRRYEMRVAHQRDVAAHRGVVGGLESGDDGAVSREKLEAVAKSLIVERRRVAGSRSATGSSMLSGAVSGRPSAMSMTTRT